MSSECWKLQARWVFPVDGAPIENGVIEIVGGRIAAIHAREEPQAVDLSNCALIPGLVNAHTHLEFGRLLQPLVPGASFCDWVRSVVAQRQRQHADSNENDLDSIRQGIQECVQSGTTTAGDILTSDWTPDALPGPRPRLVLFRELLALPDEQLAEQVALARRHLQQAAQQDRTECLVGLSPHAPYSVHPELFDRLVDLAAEHHAPLAMHLGETREELELLKHGTGELARMLKDFGVWSDTAFACERRPIDYLRRMAELDRALVVHGNYLDAAEVQLLSRYRQITVVYCPRTHTFFGHNEHPWRRMLDQGVSLALGTDSRASNPDLSLWRELLFLHRMAPDFPLPRLLELGTRDGAAALGLSDQVGSLSIGQLADITVVQFRSNVRTDPYAQLFDSRNCIVGTMRAGRWLSHCNPCGNRYPDWV